MLQRKRHVLYKNFSVTNIQMRTESHQCISYYSILITKRYLFQKSTFFKKVPFSKRYLFKKMKGTIWDNCWNDFDKIGYLLVRFSVVKGGLILRYLFSSSKKGPFEPSNHVLKFWRDSNVYYILYILYINILVPQNF